MPGESFLGVPSVLGGEKVRSRTRLVNGQLVHEQAFYRPGIDTWYAYADAVVPAANKNHIGIFNEADSGKVLTARKLFVVNLATGAISGVVVRFNIIKMTGMSGGTLITPQPADSNNGGLTRVSVATSPTSTGDAVLFPWITVTDEVPATQPLNIAAFQQAMNVLMEADSIQELVLRPGQGMAVKQVTSSAVGSLGWILVFTVDEQ